MKIGAVAVAAVFGVMFGATGSARAGFVTYVSETGSDQNTCSSIANPCRQIGGAGGALAKTNSGGVIHVLPGEYVAFAVEGKSADIIADGGQASVVNTIAGPIPGIIGNAGIGIAVGDGDVVRVRGFILNPEHGLAIGGAGGIVHVEECTFIAVANRFGIIYQPSGTSELYVRDTTVARENGATGGGGIRIRPLGSGSAKVVLDNVSVNDNSSGITIDGRATSGVNSVMISDGMVSGSTGSAVIAIDSGGGATSVAIVNTTISANSGTGVATDGARVAARVQGSQITGNGRGLRASNDSRLISVGGNLLSGNTANGAFTATESPD